MKKETATLFIRVPTRKIDVMFLVSTLLQVEVSEWLKATASPRAWLAHQKKNYQLHAKLTQIEGIVKSHLAKLNFDREALDMDVRYISEPEKVEAERKAMEEAAEAERKALAKKEAAKEKARKKAEEKKRIEDEKNRLIWPFLVQFVEDIKSGARKIGSKDYSAGSCKTWKSYVGVYEGFDPLHQFGWADINRAFVSRYINYLRRHGYMPKVVNKHITNLKALINAAFIDGVHDNQRAASLIVKNKIEDRDKAVEIYLTEEELQALYEMPL
ncbi:MAG: phage integrase SAM-like domain-containing protein, partial [Staphylococcus sp.]|nr:phage integrase SAM-like domain-containing protein [Staphylococcus sp.]